MEYNKPRTVNFICPSASYVVEISRHTDGESVTNFLVKVADTQAVFNYDLEQLRFVAYPADLIPDELEDAIGNWIERLDA